MVDAMGFCVESAERAQQRQNIPVMTSEMGRIQDGSGSERFTKRIGVENSQGCSAPLKIKPRPGQIHKMKFSFGFLL